MFYNSPMLEMRTTCEKCEVTLNHLGIAYICSYECTFCESCSESMKHVCPNCSGELLRRPRRLAAVDSTAGETD